ncbi:MAG: hypothetical protein IJJ33_02900, partial [Victivallales bacterium]|nr:hypothetical protein [Victivallales bacterium]
MRECGCTSVMQCWYFGNYPGVMNRAAGLLAFHEFDGDEEHFLTELAASQWGPFATTAARGWAYCTQGYSNYPMSNDMQ